MWRARVPSLLISVAGCLGIVGCGTAPIEGRTRIIDIPLASATSNVAFTLTTNARQSADCGESTQCSNSPEGDAAKRFNQQVQRVAEALQYGAQTLYPDLPERVPGLVDNRFDVHVVEGDAPGSTSSSDGRIALNAALDVSQSTDDWLAFVIAREMGHVIARHHEENWAASITTSVMMNILIPGSSLLKGLLSTGGSRVAANSNREVQAQEADVIARDLLKSAGYKLHDVAQSLRSVTALLDDGLWSANFRRSTENLVPSFSVSDSL